MQKIVFFGSSPFSCVVLEKIAPYCVAVVTNPDKPAGRHLKLTPNPVKVMAEKLGIPVFYDLGSKIYDPGSIGIVAAYGQIIKQEILDRFNGQMYNIHPSLLPKYRGPSPLQQQILEGVVETGVTIIQMDNLVDHGPIVATIPDLVRPNDTTVTLGNRLFELGANWIIENLLKIVNCKLKIQDESLATYTKKLTKQDGFVRYEELASRSQELERKKRAFSPWPGVWTINPKGGRIKLDL